MGNNRKLFQMEVCENFPKFLEEISQLNKDCFDGLCELAINETLSEFGYEDEKQIPKDKFADFMTALHKNRYIRLNDRIFLLVDCDLRLFGKCSAPTLPSEGG